MRNLILISLLLSSCAATSMYKSNTAGSPMHQCSLPVLVAVSTNVAPEDRHYVSDAVKFWNTELGKRVFVYMDEVPYAPDAPESAGLMVVGYPDNYTDVEGEARSVFARHIPASYKNGCIDHSYVALIRNFNTLPDTQYAALAVKHELGHVLGLDEIFMPGYIMSSVLPKFGQPIPEHLSDKEKEALKIFY